jgi:subfamily B ATP-binding cassette protein MsbA
LLSVFSVVFGVMNYGLLGPLLSVLFEEPAAGATLARPQFAWSLDYVTGLFSWVLSSIIRDRGVIRGLLFVCAALVASSLLATARCSSASTPFTM